MVSSVFGLQKYSYFCCKEHHSQGMLLLLVDIVTWLFSWTLCHCVANKDQDVLSTMLMISLVFSLVKIPVGSCKILNRILFQGPVK